MARIIKEIQEIKDGIQPLSSADPVVRSVFSLFVYKRAKRVCELPAKHQRQSALEEIPLTYRQELKAEVEKLWGA